MACFRQVHAPNWKIYRGCLILILPIIIFISYTNRNLQTVSLQDLNTSKVKTASFLINTTNCKIPNLDPFNSDVLPFLKPEKYKACSNRPLLSYIERNNDVAILKINQSVITLYSRWSMSCCYSKILRIGDNIINHSTCQGFQQEIHIFYPSIRVTCTTFFGIVYQNVHFIISPNIKNITSTRQKELTKPLKIFMLGVDSISRLSLQRSMPKVYSYLEKNFISFQGYNKIEDNTFPNLMALISGRSKDTLHPNCLRSSNLDDCDIIWKSLRENGFLTAYGEDEPNISCFNDLKAGFAEPPTDFYMRPYFLSAYQLPITRRYGLSVCSGPENTAERVLNAAKDFITVFGKDPTFALFWLNSFSHDDVNLPMSMDEKVSDFLTDSDVTNSLDESVVVIFSDHGFRFGDIRLTYSGWLEERLPFLYFQFPKSFQGFHPKFYDNLVFNAHNRLTNPYDLYMTLQHLLKLSNDSYDIKPSLGCPSCKSLFEEVRETRSCSDGSIEQHWCACEGYNTISNKNKKVAMVGQYVVHKLNKLISSFSEEGYKCVEYELKSVKTVGKSDRKVNLNNSWIENYLVIIETNPYAMFEATVQAHDDNFKLLGDFSRLNRYEYYTKCIHNKTLMKYCVCNIWYTKLIINFCYLFNCLH